MSRRRSGFTLLEMLAVVFLTTVVVAAAVNFFIDLSRSSVAAAEQTRGSRRALAILDRVARDLEGAYLVVKPEDVDPLTHPWLFFAEMEGAGSAAGTDTGADRVKFMTRSHKPRTSEAHESDLEVVAYVTRVAEDGSLELLRWSSPQLPEALDRSLPTGEDDGAQVLASGLAGFGMRFLDDTGVWKPNWDSSGLVDSSKLPVAVEIDVSLKGDETAADELQMIGPFTRSVLLPLRPFDLAAALEGGEGVEGEGDEDDPNCMTVAECAAKNPDSGVPANLIQQFGGECFSSYAHLVPPGIQLEGCQ